MSPFIIPIIFFLVTGFVIAMAIFFSSKEKQMIIEKNLDTDVIAQLYKKKEYKGRYFNLKAGIIIIFFGIGIGLGMIVDDYFFNDGWLPLILFTFTGIGFVIAFFAARVQEKKDKELEKEENQ